MSLLAFVAFWGLLFTTGAMEFNDQATGTQCQEIVRDAEGNGTRECNVGSIVVKGPVGDAQTVAEAEAQWKMIQGWVK